jgi:hypothetical protein
MCVPAKECRITVGTPKKGRILVKNYREILHQYLYHPECKFAGPDGHPVIRGRAARCSAVISSPEASIIAGRNSSENRNKVP